MKHKKTNNENIEKNDNDEMSEISDKESIVTYKSEIDNTPSYTYSTIIYIKNKTVHTFYFIFCASKIYLFWILLHYVASQLYVKLCVPQTLIGFIISPLLTVTPHCQGLRWIVYNGANIISNMWVVFGSWICTTILITATENNK